MIQNDILSFWVRVSELFEEICEEYDLLWQKRKRILDTKLLMICQQSPKRYLQVTGQVDHLQLFRDCAGIITRIK